MAYFVTSKKKENVWTFLEPFKIDIRTDEGKIKLEELEGSNEFLVEVPFNTISNKAYALVEGEFFGVNTLAKLKHKVLEYAVENRMEHAQLTQLLEPRKSSKRKEFLIEAGVDLN